MARQTFIQHPDTEALILKELYRRPTPARSHLPCPRIQRDHIKPERSQLDGKIYDSRSALFDSYRDYGARRGCDVEIVGDQVHHLTNDVAERADDRAIDTAIHQALEQHGAL